MPEAEVFISYSHHDLKWKDHVVKFMEVMNRAKRFEYTAWHDSKIDLGQYWANEINAAISQASVALLLVSPDFLQSEFILENEVPLLSKRAACGEMVMIPLLVRPCPWQVFDWLSPVQGYLSDSDILSGSSDHNIELNLTRLMTEIDRIIRDMHAVDTSALENATEAPLESPTPDTTQALTYEKPVSTGGPTMEAGFLTNRGVTDLIKHHRKNAGNHSVVGLLTLFSTKKQNTWLAVTSIDLFCVLDDEDTRVANRQVQWAMPLWEASPVSVRARPDGATGLFNIGRRQNWLYSQRLHPDPKILKASIQELINAGKHA